MLWQVFLKKDMNKIDELEKLAEQADRSVKPKFDFDQEKVKNILQVAGSILLVGIFIVGIVFLWLKFGNNDRKYDETITESGIKFDEGDLDGSITDLEKFSEKRLSDEARFGTLLSLASAYSQKGSLTFREVEYAQKSIDVINQALEINTDNTSGKSEAYRNLGYAYEIMEDYDNSIANYEKAIEINPQNAAALTGLGHAYNLLGQYDLAKTNYEKALEIDPFLDYALYNVARILYINGERELAEEKLNLLVESSTNKRFLAESFLLLGLIKTADNNFEEGLPLIEKSIENDPNFANAYVVLAEQKISSISPTFTDFNIFFEKKDQIYSEAEILVNKAIEINPNLSYAFLIKSRVLSLLKQHEEALESLKKGLEVLPDDITLNVIEKEAIQKELEEEIKSNNDFLVQFN